MQLGRIVFAALLSRLVLAQDASEAAPLRLRLAETAARAIANFRSADSIEQSLSIQGSVLHPSVLALRLRIEASLHESDRVLNQGEIQSARELIARAEGLVDKFAKKLGGD